METGRIGKTIEDFVTREEMADQIESALNSPKIQELPFEEAPVSLLSTTPMLYSSDFTIKQQDRNLTEVENELRNEMHNLFNERNDEELTRLVVAGELAKVCVIISAESLKSSVDRRCTCRYCWIN